MPGSTNNHYKIVKLAIREMRLSDRKNTTVIIETIVFAVAWIIVFACPIISHYSFGNNLSRYMLIMGWQKLLPYFLISAIHFFILVPWLLFKNRIISFIIITLSAIVIFSFFLNMHNSYNSPAYPVIVIIILFILCCTTCLRLLFAPLKAMLDGLKQENKLIQNELAFLRIRISPNFLMNTLNNIHALITIDNLKAKDTLIRLSALMRYLLFDSKKDKVSIKEELSFIKCYVGLMELRISDIVEVGIFEDIEDPEQKLPPLLFTSLIENAFKHGISSERDSFIVLQFTTKGQVLTFRLSNSVVYPQNELVEIDSDFELEDTKKRLDLLFGDSYSLKKQRGDMVYSLTLSIPL